MSGQFSVFLACILIGVAGGVLYDAFYLLRSLWKRQWFRVLCDVLFCLSFGLFYLFVSTALGLPPLHVMNVLGCLIGLFLSLKSFHKTVAFFADKLYNRITERHKRNTDHGKRRKRTNTG